MKKKHALIIGISIFMSFQMVSAQTWQRTKRLTDNSGWSGEASVTADASGHYHVVWMDDTPGGFEIFYQRSTNGGSSWTQKRLSWNSSYSMLPVVAADSGNNIHVFWYDSSAANWEIFHKKSTNKGGTWLGAKRLTWNSGSSIRPAVAVDANDYIHLVWEEDSTGNLEIFYKRSTNGGTNWTAQRLSWNSGASQYPAIATDLSDSILVVWKDHTPGNGEVYFRKGIQ